MPAEAVGALVALEVQRKAAVDAAPKPAPAEAQPEEEHKTAEAVPAGAPPGGGSGDAPLEAAATSQELLQRLEALEASVARQLDQLSASQGARIATIKVWEGMRAPAGTCRQTTP
jgi:hypothetical protein